MGTARTTEFSSLKYMINFILYTYEMRIEEETLSALISILNYDTVESLQSHMILTMSHWSSGLTCASCHKGHRF